MCFPYIGCENPLGNSWYIEVFIADTLFYFPYPFKFPKYFLVSTGKHDLRLKLLLIKSLAVRKQEKTLNIGTFFNKVNVSNNQLIKIKKNIIHLLNELVKDKIIDNEVVFLFKSGLEKKLLVKKLTALDITRRIEFIKFHEKIQKL